MGGRSEASPGGLLGLVHDAGGVEWRSKVGVAGRSDGSGKTTTRLLAVRGWVLKTDVSRATEDVHGLREELAELAARARRTELWHPSVHWAAVRIEGAWLPLSVCRELTTLRAVEPLSARLDAWARMIAYGVSAHVEHGVGLDLNPANFGFESAGGRLFYLDDETAPGLGLTELASAIVARLPEEPAAEDHGAWRAFGAQVREVISPMMGGDVSELAFELERYPLPPLYAARREAVLAGLSERAPRRARRGGADAPARTCVLADVHGNLPALEAVLAAAREEGADSYLFLGDAVGYGPWPRACVTRLAELSPAVWIRGNHDHAAATGEIGRGMNRLARATMEWTLAQLTANERVWMATLPAETGDEGWLAVHGAPRDPRRFFAYVYDLTYEDNLADLEARDVSLCFHGHTHVQLVHERSPAAGDRKLGAPPVWQLGAGRRALINPGSVGQPRDGDRRAAFAVWHRNEARVELKRVGYDIESTQAALRAEGLPSELAARLEDGL